ERGGPGAGHDFLADDAAHCVAAGVSDYHTRYRQSVYRHAEGYVAGQRDRTAGADGPGAPGRRAAPALLRGADRRRALVLAADDRPYVLPNTPGASHGPQRPLGRRGSRIEDGRSRPILDPRSAGLRCYMGYHVIG